VTAVVGLLEQARLVTLTGVGGSGKTRLAIAAATQLVDAFPDGVWFVDLAGVTDPAGVLPTIAQVLAVRESEGRSLVVSLAAYLRHKRLLLVLDNFEQVVAAALALYALLAEAPALAVLVTSRSLLRLDGEQVYAVPPLPLPAPEHVADAAALAQNPAVRLFVERGQAVRPDFALTAANAAAIAAICTQLDGLPLALELAAARVRMLPPRALLARLEQRFTLLVGGERNRPARQQTLRGTLQWSWELLQPAEQTLFRRLSVFAGGFTLAAAEAVCSPAGELDVLEGLASLVDQSLVQQQDDSSGEARFRLLATLQEFALEQLEAAGEGEALRRRHAEYYGALAEQADAAYWRSGQLLHDYLQPLDRERDNLRLALGWALAEQEAALGVRLGARLGWWFSFRVPGEGQQWLARLLALPGAADQDAMRGRALYAEGWSAEARGDWRTGLACFEEAAACLRAAEDPRGLSLTLASLVLRSRALTLEEAQALAEEALRLARGLDSPVWLANVETFVGPGLHLRGGDRAQVRGYLEESLQLSRALRADVGTASALAALALVEEQPEAARALDTEALPILEMLGDRHNASIVRVRLAWWAGAAGEWGEAAAHRRRALEYARELGSDAFTVGCLAGAAGLLTARQRPAWAVRLLAASERRREALEQHPFYGPMFGTVFADALAATHAALSDEAFAQAWVEGEALSLEQATDLARAGLSEVALSPPVVTDPTLER
jgi:predicted ATPase